MLAIVFEIAEKNHAHIMSMQTNHKYFGTPIQTTKSLILPKKTSQNMHEG